MPPADPVEPVGRSSPHGMGIGLAFGRSDKPLLGGTMGRILLGVVIGVILVIWLLASCVGMIF
jgi:hypothetical protein